MGEKDTGIFSLTLAAADRGIPLFNFSAAELFGARAGDTCFAVSLSRSWV